MYSSTLALHHPLKPHAESRDTLPRLVLESVLGRTAREGRPAPPAQELQGRRSDGLARLVLASSQAKGGSAHAEQIGPAPS